MPQKDTYQKKIGKNNEIYLHCTKCNFTLKWTPYEPKRLKGEVGKLSIASIEYTTAPLCRDCMSLLELFFAIRDLRESLQSTNEVRN